MEPDPLANVEQVQRTIEANLAIDPHFYDDPTEPPPRQFSASSNTKFALNGFQPFGKYGAQDSPVPLDWTQPTAVGSNAYGSNVRRFR